jgi:AcrR family transcriptional regulator
VADRVGMQPPSLYSHFASKNAIYDAMFEAAWNDWWAQSMTLAETAPKNRRARLIAVALAYFDHAVADLARHQLMNVRSLPDFEPSPEAYQAALQSYQVMREQLPMTSPEDIDVYTALISWLVAQQLANDPGGERWRRLLPRVISYLADDLALPPDPQMNGDRS